MSQTRVMKEEKKGFDNKNISLILFKYSTLLDLL